MPASRGQAATAELAQRLRRLPVPILATRVDAASPLLLQLQRGVGGKSTYLSEALVRSQAQGLRGSRLLAARVHGFSLHLTSK